MYIKRSETLSQIFLLQISNETFMFDNSDCNKWSLFSDHLRDQNNFFLSDAKTKKCIFKIIIIIIIIIIIVTIS